MADVDLEKMTTTELREYALKNHPAITGAAAMEKEELIAAVKKAQEEEVKETPKKENAVGKGKPGKKALKEKIRAMKAEKEKLLKANNKKAMGRLRKKIKKLKRMTKRAAGSMPRAGKKPG